MADSTHPVPFIPSEIWLKVIDYVSIEFAWDTFRHVYLKFPSLLVEKFFKTDREKIQPGVLVLVNHDDTLRDTQMFYLSPLGDVNDLHRSLPSAFEVIISSGGSLLVKNLTYPVKNKFEYAVTNIITREIIHLPNFCRNDNVVLYHNFHNFQIVRVADSTHVVDLIECVDLGSHRDYFRVAMVKLRNRDEEGEMHWEIFDVDEELHFDDDISLDSRKVVLTVFPIKTVSVIKTGFPIVVWPQYEFVNDNNGLRTIFAMNMADNTFMNIKIPFSNLVICSSKSTLWAFNKDGVEGFQCYQLKHFPEGDWIKFDFQLQLPREVMPLFYIGSNKLLLQCKEEEGYYQISDDKGNQLLKVDLSFLGKRFRIIQFIKWIFRC